MGRNSIIQSYPIRFKKSPPTETRYCDSDRQQNETFNIDVKYLKDFRTARRDWPLPPYKEFPKGYSNAMREVLMRGEKWCFRTSRNLKWFLEETALAVNEKVSPETILFELVDDSQFKTLSSNREEDGELYFLSVLLRGSIRERTLTQVHLNGSFH